MIRRSSLRWRLVSWVTGVMLVVCAIVFVVVYEQTGSQLRSRVQEDVRGDVRQLSDAVRALRGSSAPRLLVALRGYVSAQPYSGNSALLFAELPGRATVSNHPELFGSDRPDDGESAVQQQRENVLGHRLLSGRAAQRTVQVADVGAVRLAEQLVSTAAGPVRVGAGEALTSVTRAQRTVARSFLIAGAIGLVLVLVASYLAGAVVSLPLRRMARVAARVDDGDLHPRMATPASASREIRVLAESFNHMLDRLAAAFAHQREFVADASHELRTPLTVIGGQLEILAAQEHPSRDEIQRVQRLVTAEIARTSRLVDDMLLLARSERHDFVRRQTIELPEFLEDLWRTTTAGHDRRFTLGRVPDATLDGDPDRLAQALRNLIDNALAHTVAPRGRVSLSTEALATGGVRFTVTDDGPGIPDGQHDRIFDRFHRTDEGRVREAGGAGLGLAIVRAIAEAHGGEIRASPQTGGGARFELDLPGLRIRPEGAAPRPSPSARS